MKRKILYIFMCILFCYTTSVAESYVNVTINDRLLIFDVPGRIIDGRTMVPMRKIFEALGADVEWDENTKTVTAHKEETVVKCTEGMREIVINGKKKIIDVSPILVNGRTLVPVRFIAEAFDCEVDWDSENMTVQIKEPYKNDVKSEQSEQVNETKKSENTERVIYDSSKENRVISYYSDAPAILPTFDSVTGKEYKYTSRYAHVYKGDLHSFDHYRTQLLSEYNYKWCESNNKNGTTTTLLFTPDGDELISISYASKYNEVWVMYIAKQNK